MGINLASDNVAGAAPEILEAIVRANVGSQPSYGADDITARLGPAFAELFERDVVVFPLATGTAANALALAALAPAWGAIYCHEVAHIANDECNAPEFYSGGAKLVPLPGANGKLDPETLAAAIARAVPHDEHNAQPTAVSLSQASELGTVYTPDEVADLARVARTHGLGVHLDGARLANAVVHLGCSFADITWRAGVDAVSFGATKNGALAAEALILFDPDLAASLPFRRKRGGHLLSKMRFVSAQLEAYLAGGLWRRNAAHANAMAARLAEGLAEFDSVRCLYPVESNELFVAMPPEALARLADLGHVMAPWGEPDDSVVRLVTAFNTEPAALESFLGDVGRALT
ncbi:MAG TPA: beta-eliminating lyase-related protein [Alphaproteobacteria bacterium]|nr:beta-eliminating lyase-related protein [Alphaproteobacteria bacterium]